MASEWRIVKVANCAAFQEGYVNPSQTKPEYFGNPVKWLRAVDLNDSFVWDTSRHFTQAGFESAGKSALLFEPNTLAISKSGTIGRLGILKAPMCGNRAVINIRPKDNVCDSRFLFYSLMYHRPRIIAVADGSVQKNLYISNLGAIEIELPGLEVQRSIGRFLRTLDDKIELNRKMNETLEAMARALFKSWFVDFDPVRAKAERRDTGLPAPIAALFPDSFEDSELGEIPKGWTIEPIDNLTEAVGGSTPSTKDANYWSPEVHAWATPKDLSALHSPVLLKTERRISEQGLAQISSGLLPVGAVLMSSRAPIGYLAIAEIPVAINQGFIAMKPKEDVPNLFLLYWAECAQEIIKSRANGSTFLEISKSNFRQIGIARPNTATNRAFDEMVRPWYERVVSNEKQSAMLMTLRDALLPKLISGELRLRDTECVMAESI